jgi:hypothetical protein
MKRLLAITLVCLILLGCNTLTDERPKPRARPPLADTLLSILAQLGEAARNDQADQFIGLLDSAEARRLARLTEQHGFASLRGYLQHQFANWPDPDTLAFSDLMADGRYARLALEGAGLRAGRRQEMVRYTFALFARADQDWKLAAVSSLEKPRYDRYGTELGYLETELPPKLRFPRLF